MKYTGLNDEEVLINRNKYGKNSLPKEQRESFLKLLIGTFGDPIIKILLIALAVKTLFLFQNFDWYETIGIVLAILLASFISAISEYGSEKAFDQLQEESSKINTIVLRERKKTSIPVDEVVVNDIVYLYQGSRIPADGIIIDGYVNVDESSLNGETKEIHKKVNDTVYQGTVIYNGNAYMKVNLVGEKTMYGKLALELQSKQPDTPLKIRLRELAGFISKIGYVGAILVFLSYLFNVIFIKNYFNINLIISTITDFRLMFGYILYGLTLSVAIIIVAVPEGLPMMITLVLSSNMKRMLKNNVLVRKMVGIETAGNIDILFSDKTGTITNGKLEVTSIVTSDMLEFHTELELKKIRLYEIIRESCLINNESSYDNNRIIGGNITDRSILNFFSPYIYKVQKKKVIPFDSSNKYMATVLSNDKCYLKGAFEVLFDNCRWCYDSNGNKTLFYNKTKIEKMIDKSAKLGNRIIVLAEKFSTDLIFIGFVTIRDTIRKEAKDGIKLIKNAHIQPVMITGDNKDTAIAIAKEVGIMEENSIVLTHDDLAAMSDDRLCELIPKISVVARLLPTDKSRLVRLSQNLGYVVGMTGDGVNDAPALKQADVGFGMGSGTEVSKEASDIVILDNNILSISRAILYGRTIFKSIRKFIIVQLTINMCALSLSIIGPFINIDTPITVIQMLWINMVMDTLAGLAFSYEPALIEYMNEYPKKKSDPIINHYMITQILFTGIYSALLCILFLKLPIVKMLFRNSDKYLYTAFFGLFIFIDIFNSFNARTNRLNILANIFKNKVFLAIILFIVIVQILIIYTGGDLFRTYGLTFFELQFMILCAATVIPVDWTRKIYLKKHNKNNGV